MPPLTKAAKVTCEIDKTLTAQAQRALADIGVGLVQAHARRSVVLRERVTLPFLPPTTGLAADPIETYEFYVPPTTARSAALACAHALRLTVPGRGSIYVEEVEIVTPTGVDAGNETNATILDAAERLDRRLSPLVLVNTVVQRGRGNEIARSALETGSNVPSINFGVGTGVRDRLGLLRIAIPAEKEIVSLLIDPQDQEAILDTLIAAGRLDQPGRGFIAAYPIALGLANPKGFRGRQRHGATMDQVISALDELKSGTEWRRRTGAADGTVPRRRRWLTHLVNVTLNCNEGSADRLLRTAMSAGAGGATITRTKLFSPTAKGFALSPAREIIDFGIGPDRLDDLIRALDEARAFGEHAGCLVEVKPLPMAFTYAAA